MSLIETDQLVIDQTRTWINKVVIGCNFCPFASKVMKQGGIHFEVVRDGDTKELLERLAPEINRLDQDASIETTLVILPDLFPSFYDYLDMIAICEKTLRKLGKEGIYQVASFHPSYIFADSLADDPANYTNRSPYPMIHLLREDSITNALKNFPDPGNIPERNIDFARKKGLAYMQVLWNACF
jgi:uncharacterized protein